MDQYKFNSDDEQKVVKFLNMVAKHAKFDMKTDELINYFNLLAHMQKSVLPKIKANVLEVVKVVESKVEPKPNKKSGKSKSK